MPDLMFRDMLYEQSAFQQIVGDVDLGQREKVARISQLSLLMHGETASMLEALGYKTHRPFQQPNWQNAMHEWVDQFKYLLAVAAVAGWSAAELEEAYTQKSATVLQRWERERAEDRSQPCAVFDIDGVLCEYLPMTDDDIANGGFLEVVPTKLLTFLGTVRQWGLRVVLITSRKDHMFRRVVNDTEAWLAANRVAYDSLIFAYDKATAADAFNVVFAVEDSPRHAMDYAEHGIRTFLVPGHYPLDDVRSGQVFGGGELTVLGSVDDVPVAVSAWAREWEEAQKWATAQVEQGEVDDDQQS